MLFSNIIQYHLTCWITAPKYVLSWNPRLRDNFLGFIWSIPPRGGRQKWRKDEDEAEEKKKTINKCSHLHEQQRLISFSLIQIFTILGDF